MNHSHTHTQNNSCLHGVTAAPSSAVTSPRHAVHHIHYRTVLLNIISKGQLTKHLLLSVGITPLQIPLIQFPAPWCTKPNCPALGSLEKLTIKLSPAVTTLSWFSPPCFNLCTVLLTFWRGIREGNYESSQEMCKHGPAGFEPDEGLKFF